MRIMKAPCEQCPFRKDVKPFLHPDRAREIAENSHSFDCHKTITYADDYEGDAAPQIITGKEKICAGWLAMQIKRGTWSPGKGFTMPENTYAAVNDMHNAYFTEYNKRHKENKKKAKGAGYRMSKVSDLGGAYRITYQGDFVGWVQPLGSSTTKWHARGPRGHAVGNSPQEAFANFTATVPLPKPKKTWTKDTIISRGVSVKSAKTTYKIEHANGHHVVDGTPTTSLIPNLIDYGTVDFTIRKERR